MFNGESKNKRINLSGKKNVLLTKDYFIEQARLERKKNAILTKTENAFKVLKNYIHYKKYISIIQNGIEDILINRLNDLILKEPLIKSEIYENILKKCLYNFSIQSTFLYSKYKCYKYYKSKNFDNIYKPVFILLEITRLYDKIENLFDEDLNDSKNVVLNEFGYNEINYKTNFNMEFYKNNDNLKKENNINNNSSIIQSNNTIFNKSIYKMNTYGNVNIFEKDKEIIKNKLQNMTNKKLYIYRHKKELNILVNHLDILLGSYYFYNINIYNELNEDISNEMNKKIKQNFDYNSNENNKYTNYGNPFLYAKKKDINKSYVSHVYFLYNFVILESFSEHYTKEIGMLNINNKDTLLDSLKKIRTYILLTFDGIIRIIKKLISYEVICTDVDIFIYICDMIFLFLYAKKLKIKNLYDENNFKEKDYLKILLKFVLFNIRYIDNTYYLLISFFKYPFFQLFTNENIFNEELSDLKKILIIIINKTFKDVDIMKSIIYNNTGEKYIMYDQYLLLNQKSFDEKFILGVCIFKNMLMYIYCNKEILNDHILNILLHIYIFLPFQYHPYIYKIFNLKKILLKGPIKDNTLKLYNYYFNNKNKDDLFLKEKEGKNWVYKYWRDKSTVYKSWMNINNKDYCKEYDKYMNIDSDKKYYNKNSIDYKNEYNSPILKNKMISCEELCNENNLEELGYYYDKDIVECLIYICYKGSFKKLDVLLFILLPNRGIHEKTIRSYRNYYDYIKCIFIDDYIEIIEKRNKIIMKDICEFNDTKSNKYNKNLIDKSFNKMKFNNTTIDKPNTFNGIGVRFNNNNNNNNINDNFDQMVENQKNVGFRSMCNVDKITSKFKNDDTYFNRNFNYEQVYNKETPNKINNEDVNEKNIFFSLKTLVQKKSKNKYKENFIYNSCLINMKSILTSYNIHIYLIEKIYSYWFLECEKNDNKFFGDSFIFPYFDTTYISIYCSAFTQIMNQYIRENLFRKIIDVEKVKSKKFFMNTKEFKEVCRLFASSLLGMLKKTVNTIHYALLKVNKISKKEKYPYIENNKNKDELEYEADENEGEDEDEDEDEEEEEEEEDDEEEDDEEEDEEEDEEKEDEEKEDEEKEDEEKEDEEEDDEIKKKRKEKKGKDGKNIEDEKDEIKKKNEEIYNKNNNSNIQLNDKVNIENKDEYIKNNDNNEISDDIYNNNNRSLYKNALENFKRICFEYSNENNIISEEKNNKENSCKFENMNKINTTDTFIQIDYESYILKYKSDWNKFEKYIKNEENAINIVLAMLDNLEKYHDTKERMMLINKKDELKNVNEIKDEIHVFDSNNENHMNNYDNNADKRNDATFMSNKMNYYLYGVEKNGLRYGLLTFLNLLSKLNSYVHLFDSEFFVIKETSTLLKNRFNIIHESNHHNSYSVWSCYNEESSYYLPHNDIHLNKNIKYVNEIINYLLRKAPFTLPFEDRLLIFYHYQNQSKAIVRDNILDNFFENDRCIRRSYLLEDAFKLFHSLDSVYLKKRIRILFIDKNGNKEAGVDGGGLFKEFIILLCREIFNANFILFESKKNNTLFPKIFYDNDCLLLYEFAGKVIGKAIYEKVLIETIFNKGFLNFLFTKEINVNDLYFIDQQIYNSFMYLQNSNNVENLSLTFSLNIKKYPDMHADHYKQIINYFKKISINTICKKKNIQINTQNNGTIMIRREIINPYNIDNSLNTNSLFTNRNNLNEWSILDSVLSSSFNPDVSYFSADSDHDDDDDDDYYDESYWVDVNTVYAGDENIHNEFDNENRNRNIFRSRNRNRNRSRNRRGEIPIIEDNINNINSFNILNFDNREHSIPREENTIGLMNEIGNYNNILNNRDIELGRIFINRVNRDEANDSPDKVQLMKYELEESNEFECIDLIFNGKNILVNDKNKSLYMKRFVNCKYNNLLKRKRDGFLNGLSEIIPIKWFRLFNADELITLISGDDKCFDVEDLKKNVVYRGGYNENSKTVIDLFDILTNFSPNEKSMFLMFVTSCSRSPLLGFQELDPKFCISKANCTNRLPSAATCTNMFILPDYQSKKLLYKNLMTAIQNTQGFDLA